MKNYKTCIVPSCKNTTTKCPQKLFISTPKNRERRKVWLQVAGRCPQSISDKSAVFFCEDHFDLPNDMENYMQYKVMGSVCIIRIRKDCVPFVSKSRPERRKIKKVAAPARPPAAKRKKKQHADKIKQKHCEETEKSGEINDSDPKYSTEADVSESQSLIVKAQCLFCAGHTEDFTDITTKNKPYMSGNSLKLALNDISIELSFPNDSLPKTVCRACDSKLLKLHKFVKEVKAAQYLINQVCDVKEELEFPIEETEPNENIFVDVNNINETEDNKDGIVNSITFTETAFVKQTGFTHKRKVDEIDAPQKFKMSKNCEDYELIVEVKEEVVNMDYSEQEMNCEPVEYSDTGTDRDVKPSKTELAKCVKLYNINNDTLSSKMYN